MRFIQVGAGGFGKVWLQVLPRNSTATLEALVDIDEATLKAAAEQVGLPADRCFTDYREAFSTVKADAALCIVPPDRHADVALAAFENGLHVLTEKPLADTMPAAVRMVTEAEAAGRTLMVSQNYRFRTWVRTMRHLVESGQFGAAEDVLVKFAKAPRFEGSFRLKMEHPLVKDMSIHHFDLMRAVTGPRAAQRLRPHLEAVVELVRPRPLRGGRLRVRGRPDDHLPRLLGGARAGDDVGRRLARRVRRARRWSCAGRTSTSSRPTTPSRTAPSPWTRCRARGRTSACWSSSRPSRRSASRRPADATT